ncbi:DUF397 domain-containing protein [Streptomyces sp. MST-110588]|uniref:DUF397 domain-containing protein n=1 Tax=Streptomyces sp. MST-110588 TaxID=2833628 RepID=UPI001F5DF396|nr:DUF397 domain-containing protein [Streptomyces sp. MST-110588]UNO44183.1 DUF397 domain-containing protein [Streptomyces sp. MST-110588]
MPEFVYRKSSYSNQERGCVEVAVTVPGAVAVRDSKDPDGSILQLSPAAWTAFRVAVTEGTLVPLR